MEPGLPDCMLPFATVGGAERLQTPVGQEQSGLSLARLASESNI